MVVNNNYLYIAGANTQQFIKVDSTFNIVKQISLTGSQTSNGIDYDGCNDRILALTHTSTDNLIWVFNTNLTSIGNISLTASIGSTINPSSVAYFKNKIFVGGNNGNIYIFNNTGLTVSFISSYKVCNTSTYINSIDHDTFGNLLITCNNEGYIYFYSSANVFLTAYPTGSTMSNPSYLVIILSF
jgi:hypothetical protein